MTKYDDSVVKWFIYPAVVFLLIGMLVGTFIAWNAFVFADYFSGEYVHFGRQRPVHVLTVIWLWLVSANIGLLYYMVPRLCGVPLWSKTLGYWSAGVWWFALILGAYSQPFGTNFGWEYAEMPTWLGWIPVKFLVLVGLVLVATNIFATIFTRKYEKLYVSLWYAMGGLVWGAITFIIGNFAVNWVPEGISRVNTNFFFVHSLVGMIATPLGLSAAYYFLPKLSNTPIYSHKLSMVGFWTIAFVYPWVGAHHIIHGPASQWLQTVSIIFSMWLIIPVWTVVTNLFGTLHNNWHKYNESAAIRFIIMGTMFYLLGSTQGSFMALRNLNEITSKTDYVIGHAHITLYGTFTFYAMAGIYGVLPALTGRSLYSKRLADWHFTLNVLGAMLMFLSLSIGGYIQGMEWATWADGASYAQFNQRISQLPFLQTVANVKPWWMLRGISALIIVSANCIFFVNVFNTVILDRNPKEVRRKQIASSRA